MQATKQHSPRTKKCSTSSASNGTENLNNSLATTKSVAQMIEEVTRGGDNVINNANSGSGQIVTSKQVSVKASSDNSVENDQEVESITNRASKLDLTNIVPSSSGSSRTNGISAPASSPTNDNSINSNTGTAQIITTVTNGTASATTSACSSSNGTTLMNTTLNVLANTNGNPIIVAGTQQATATSTSSTCSNAITSGEHVGNNNNNCNSTTTVKSSSPSLLLDSNPSSPTTSLKQQYNFAASTATSTTNLLLNPRTMPSLASSRQIATKNFNLPDHSHEEVSKQVTIMEGLPSTNSIIKNGLSDPLDSHITLDAKVPYPSKGDFHQEDDNISYYYDKAPNVSIDITKQVTNVSNNKNSKIKIKSSAMKENKLSIIVPTKTNTTNNCNNSQHRQHDNPQSCSSYEHLNNIPNFYEDEYDRGYYNARVENAVDCDGFVTTPTSPKAKSAPATPCNVTPNEFHQHKSHLNSILNPSPANTLPPDIRKNISATCRKLPSSMGDDETSLQTLNQIVNHGEGLLRAKDFVGAIRYFDQCIEIAKNCRNSEYLKRSYRIYGQRAEAQFNLNNFNAAIEDSKRASELNPKWTQAYYIQGRSHFSLGQYPICLAIYSYGLAQDSTNKGLFDALVDAASKAGFEFEALLNRLKSEGLDNKLPVVVSVIGQEILSQGHSEDAAIILESALKIGFDDKNFKGSVLSTLSHVYCSMRKYEKAISYMQMELELESEVEDVSGRCRVLSNLGYTYYKLREFDESFKAHKEQLRLAMNTHLYPQASMALNAIGHLHAARNNFDGAFQSHTNCLNILKGLGDNTYVQLRELLSIGHIYSMMGNLKAAEAKYNEVYEALKCNTINSEDYYTCSIMYHFNSAYLALRTKSFSTAEYHYQQIFALTKISDKILTDKQKILFEMRAANGMGQAHRLSKNFDSAKSWFEKQLELAKMCKDLSGHSQALCNLGMVHQHFKNYSCARQQFEKNLSLVEDKDPLMRAYAHSYLGGIHYIMNKYSDAQDHYAKSSIIFKEFKEYCTTERRIIDSNMATLQDSLHMIPHHICFQHPQMMN